MRASGVHGNDIDRMRRQVDELNRRYPVGTPCVFWPGAKIGPGRPGKVRWPFSILSGHTVVGWLEGATGCIAASHIDFDVASNPKEPEPVPGNP